MLFERFFKTCDVIPKPAGASGSAATAECLGRPFALQVSPSQIPHHRYELNGTR